MWWLTFPTSGSDVCVSQHYQWICLTTKRRAQDFPAEGFIASAQSQITQCLPSTGTWILKWFLWEDRSSTCMIYRSRIWKHDLYFRSRPAASLLLISVVRSHPPVSQAVGQDASPDLFPFNLLGHKFKCLDASLVGFVCLCAAGLLRGAVFREGQHSNWAGM